MLVKELIAHLEKMNENATVKVEIKTKVGPEDNVFTSAPINTIEFGDDKVILKGNDELVEWD